MSWGRTLQDPNLGHSADTSYLCSGSSTAVSSVTLDIAGPSTVVLASSSTKEESQKIKTDTGAETSAFTYALERATGADRDSVDSGDGFITYDELEQYSTITLKDWLAKGRILGPMHPTIWSNIQDFLVYDPSHVKNPNSLFRQFYLSQLLADQLGVKDVQLSLVGGTAEVVLPPLSKEVKLTASALSDSAPPVGNLSAEAKDFKSKSERMRSEALVSPGVAAEPGGILIPAEKP